MPDTKERSADEVSKPPHHVYESPTCKPPAGPQTAAQNEAQPQSNDNIKYGELVVLGYNGHLTSGDKGRRRSKYILRKRTRANGVKPFRKHLVVSPQSSKAVQDNEQHSVSYTLSRNKAVIVEYKPDDDTDMFQIGRSSEHPIDFVVMDTIPGHLRTTSENVTQSTISRFACRIIIDRNPPYTAKIYAAGFDSGKNIFLGEKAVKWHSGDEIDGLTTNGVFIMQPQGGFSPTARPNVWREVSVDGGIFPLRESRPSPLKSCQILEEDNILRDGTLIDLCGATLVWRSALGLIASPPVHHDWCNKGYGMCYPVCGMVHIKEPLLLIEKNSPCGGSELISRYLNGPLPYVRRHITSEHEFQVMVHEINAGRPQCPVGLNTLVLPTRGSLNLRDRQPYVYLQCGHVHGKHEWGQTTESSRKCPLCLEVGPFVKLEIGCELSLYVDSDSPTYCFSPCGHVASENSVRYWCLVTVPHGCHGFRAICPFCATPLSEPGYVKLIFQDHTD